MVRRQKRVSSLATNHLPFHSNGLSFTEATYLHDFRMSIHAHEEAQIIFIITGTVLDERKRQTFLQEPATLIFLQSGELHSTTSLKGFKSFQLSITPQWLKRLPRYSFEELPARDRHPLPVRLASRMYREFCYRDHLTPLVLEGLLLQLLGEILRQPNERSLRPRWLKKVTDLLHDQFSAKLSLESIAEHAGVHPAHLSRTFRRHHLCTLGEYVRNLRIERAKHSLANSGASLCEIALAVGYSDQSHFSAAFKRNTGFTPCQFRKSVGGALITR